MTTIHYMVFRGTGFRDVRYKDEHDLIRAGHFGISFDGGITIYGFHPCPQAVESFNLHEVAAGRVPDLITYLKNHHAIDGCVQNDTPVFIRAAHIAQEAIQQHQSPRTQVWQITITVNEQTFQDVVNHVMYLHHNGISSPYRFPPDDGSSMPDDYNNCATHPRVYNLRIIDPVGRILAVVAYCSQHGTPLERESAMTTMTTMAINAITDQHQLMLLIGQLAARWRYAGMHEQRDVQQDVQQEYHTALSRLFALGYDEPGGLDVESELPDSCMPASYLERYPTL